MRFYVLIYPSPPKYPLLSILFMRFSQAQAWPRLGLVACLSILFMRFLHIGSRRKAINTSFNSLYEIPVGGGRFSGPITCSFNSLYEIPKGAFLHLKITDKLFFQFSLWDSCAIVGGAVWGFTYTSFNSLYEIRPIKHGRRRRGYSSFNSLYEIPRVFLALFSFLGCFCI